MRESRTYGYLCGGRAVKRAQPVHVACAVHESAPGTSRQFTKTDQFGRNRRHSGHAAKPCGALVRSR